MPESLSFCVLDDRAVLAVAGEDRAAFLQGLVSNDVAKVGPGRAIYAALLTPQGKYLHDFFIAAAGDALWLDVDAARLEDLRRRLALYRLRSKVTITPAGDRLCVVAAWGTGALAALGLADSAGAAGSWKGGVACVDPRLARLGARLILPCNDAEAALAAAGFVPAVAADYDRLRLAQGIPDGSRDLAVEKTVLLEAGFDELNGIDWQKGCYVGQELTARTRYRGLVKKRLLPVAVEGTLQPPGTPVMLGGEEVGELRSGRDGVALALLRLDAVEKAAAGAALTAGEAALTVLKPEWMTA